VNTTLAAAARVHRQYDRLFYIGMALAAIVAVLAGFTPTYFLRSRYQSTPLPLYLHVHGLVFTTWILFFITQAALVAARRISVHRTIGWAGAALAGLMIVVGVTAGVLSGRRDLSAGRADETLTFLTTPLFSMLVFLVLVAAAVYARRRPETHKRLMLLATISILDAPVARWPLEFVSTTGWGFYVLTDAFLVPAIAYDIWSRGRVHIAYIWGGLLIIGCQALRAIVGQTEAWHTVARAILR
jgi:hypothetical protein